MSKDKTTITVYLTLRHESGPEQDDDTLIDYFCGTFGEQNGAGKNALRLSVHTEESIASGDDKDKSVYVVELADDRPVA